MRCPFCGTKEDKVLDSRETPDGSQVKRRRECKSCGRRFTTFEQVEEIVLYVVKRSGRREPFDRAKILRGLRLACTGRPVSHDRLEEIADEVERTMHNRLEREVPSADIGEIIMDRLKSLDSVAYVRFASVYMQFEDASQFREILGTLRKRAKS